MLVQARKQQAQLVVNISRIWRQLRPAGQMLLRLNVILLPQVKGSQQSLGCCALSVEGNRFLQLRDGGAVIPLITKN